MKRRKFIKISLLTGMVLNTNFTFAKDISKSRYMILEKVYEVLFPKTKNMPSAKEFKVMNYLIKNISHRSFDDYDKNLILTGADDFASSFPEFIKSDIKKREKIIKSVINSNDYAQSWLSKLLYYGFEAMLSDPIYGGNPNKIAWNSLQHSFGYPQPKKTYGQKL